MDRWLSSHVDLVSLLIVATGFVLRLMHNTGNYLNADEATNYLLAHETNLLAAYQASLGDAHPPLFVVLLYLWQHIGTSEFVLRLLPVVAGTAALWVGYRWVSLALAPVEGLVALLLLTFSPTLISLSSEVRNYSLLLLTLAGSLYFLERSLRDKSGWMMVLHFLTLCAANLTNYAAVWATTAISLYAAVRAFGEKAPARLVRLWGILQLGVAGLWAFLYVTQIRSLLGAGERAAREGWLRSSYFHPGQDQVLPFMSRQLVALFTYLFASTATGVVAFCLLAAGIVLLLTAWRSTADLSRAGSTNTAEPSKSETFLHRVRARSLALLVLAPFAASFGAAVTGVFPFGGVRQDSFLFLFAAVGISVTLARFVGRRTWLVLMATAIAAPVWMQTASGVGQERLTLDQRSTLMSAAVSYIRDTIPPNSVMLVDRQSCYILRYYLDRGQIADRFRMLPGGLRELRCGGYRIVFDWRWNFDPQAFRANLGHITDEYCLGPAAAVWVADIGWDAGFTENMVRKCPFTIFPARRSFGRNIELLQVLDSYRDGQSEGGASPTHDSSRAETNKQDTCQ